MDVRYLNELKKCTICEWKCKVSRLDGEREYVASDYLRLHIPALRTFSRVIQSLFLAVAFGVSIVTRTAFRNILMQAGCIEDIRSQKTSPPKLTGL
jgi:hypothetical protein